MGDFYELFFDDAEIAARALGIVLTKRGKHEGMDIPMCGVPVERAEDYLNRLIGQGHRVAVCEQIEDPAEARKRGGKSVVRREVVRLVTPGTITEELLLDPVRANSLLAIARRPDRAGNGLWARLRRYFNRRPSSSPVPPRLPSRPRSPVSIPPKSSPRSASRASLPRAARARNEPAHYAAWPRGGRERKRGAPHQGFFQARHSGGTGRPFLAETAAAAAAIFYIERTQFSRPPGAEPANAARARDARMDIDAATRANLELTRTLAGARAAPCSPPSTRPSPRRAAGFSPSVWRRP